MAYRSPGRDYCSQFKNTTPVELFQSLRAAAMNDIKVRTARLEKELEEM